MKKSRDEILAKYPDLGQALGKVIPIHDVSAILGIDIRVIRCNPWRYGGIPGGAKKIIFYERTVENALLGFNKQNLDRPSCDEWEEKEETRIQNQKGSFPMGNDSPRRVEKPNDPYNLLT